MSREFNLLKFNPSVRAIQTIFFFFLSHHSFCSLLLQVPGKRLIVAVVKQLRTERLQYNVTMQTRNIVSQAELPDNEESGSLCDLSV